MRNPCASTDPWDGSMESTALVPDDHDEKSPQNSMGYHPLGSDLASAGLPMNFVPQDASTSRSWPRRWLVCMLSLAALLSFTTLHFSLSNPPCLSVSAGNMAQSTSRGDIIQMKHLNDKYIPAPPAQKGERGKRLIVVGDVHGCRAELEHLLGKIDFDRHYDHLILTGDMVDKGPDSHGVIKLARHMGASCVRGNHEDKLLNSHFGLSQTSSNESTSSLGKSLSKADYDYLLECPLILTVGNVPSLRTKQTAIVHAGLVPGIDLADQDPFAVMHMRTMSKHWKPSEERDGEPWWRLWNGVQKSLHKRDRMTVIYGHDARMGLVKQKYSFGLDTACVKGRELTALVLGGGKHERELVSVRCGEYFG